MAKPTKVNPLDRAIQLRIAAYSSIEGYPGILKDEGLKAAHVFIAGKMDALYSSSEIVIKSFIPAVNKTIAETKGYLNTSVYKHLIRKDVEEGLNAMKNDTIRLGYVMFFHKFENFVKDYVAFLEKTSESYTQETGQSFLQYCKANYDFDPFQWWKFPIIHKVNFISNCTKHHDGKCRLDNPKHAKPKMYTTFSDTDILNPDLQQFKEDTTNLIKTISTTFVPILSGICAVRGWESLSQDFDNLKETLQNTISSNIEQRKLTYNDNGVDVPLLTGTDLQEHDERGERYRNDLIKLEGDATGYTHKIAQAVKLIQENIRLLTSFRG